MSIALKPSGAGWRLRPVEAISLGDELAQAGEIGPAAHSFQAEQTAALVVERPSTVDLGQARPDRFERAREEVGLARSAGRSSSRNSAWLRSFEATHSRAKARPSGPSAASSCRRRIAAVEPIRGGQTRATGSPNLLQEDDVDVMSDRQDDRIRREVHRRGYQDALNLVCRDGHLFGPARITNRSPLRLRLAPKVLITSCIVSADQATPAHAAQRDKTS